jgi:hypothetical protein
MILLKNSLGVLKYELSFKIDFLFPLTIIIIFVFTLYPVLGRA